jgi:hypothetical protein
MDSDTGHQQDMRRLIFDQTPVVLTTIHRKDVDRIRAFIISSVLGILVACLLIRVGGGTCWKKPGLYHSEGR